MAQLSAIEPRAGNDQRRLLVAQSNPFVARSLARLLSPHFERVHSAVSITEAEEILKDPTSTPTDLVCGQYFGDDCPSGSELVQRWRSEYPTLRRVVMATGVTDVPAQIEGVDAIVGKPTDPSVLASLLA